MNRSIMNSGINAVSLGFAIIAGVSSLFIFFYGLLSAQWILVGFSSLGFIYVGRVYHLHKATSRLPGGVNDQVYREIAEDARFQDRPVVRAERKRHHLIRRLTVWAPLIAVGIIIFIWGSNPIIKLVLVYIPPVIGKLTGTM